MCAQNSNSTNKSIEEIQINSKERKQNGEFVRGVSGFRNILEKNSIFEPEPKRYHLFVALNCPWCHRVTLARNILGLQNSITMDIVFPNRTSADHPHGSNQWEFAPERKASLTNTQLSECTLDTATGYNFRVVRQIYQAEESQEGSLPILYDKKTNRIVSNESAEIVRMLNKNALSLGSNLDDKERLDLYPKTKQSKIDLLNEQIYVNINNGAYKAGFSSNQSIYKKAYENYFNTLNLLEKRLASNNHSFLTGSKFTEADLRLFPTLYRHDPVYYLRMKLNGAKILDYPYLWNWLCRVYALPGVSTSNSLVHCRQGYFGRSWNNVVPLGPIKPMTYPEAYKHPELADLNNNETNF